MQYPDIPLGLDGFSTRRLGTARTLKHACSKGGKEEERKAEIACGGQVEDNENEDALVD